MQLSARRKVSAARSTKSAAPSTKQRHRAIANARERDRTESVNYAFTLLRRLLPTDPPNRKLSKIEVLRLATSYIQHLDNVRTAVFHGDSVDNICTRLRHQGNTVGGKVFCTFCVTASKTRQVKSSTGNTTSSQAQTTTQIITTNEADWSTQPLASYDLVAFTTTATPVDIAALEQPAPGDVIYAQLDNMPVFETVDPPMDPMTTNQVTECINFDWSCADLVDHLNQWNGSFTE